MKTKITLNKNGLYTDKKGYLTLSTETHYTLPFQGFIGTEKVVFVDIEKRRVIYNIVNEDILPSNEKSKFWTDFWELQRIVEENIGFKTLEVKAQNFNSFQGVKTKKDFWSQADFIYSDSLSDFLDLYIPKKEASKLLKQAEQKFNDMEKAKQEAERKLKSMETSLKTRYRKLSKLEYSSIETYEAAYTIYCQDYIRFFKSKETPIVVLSNETSLERYNRFYEMFKKLKIDSRNYESNKIAKFNLPLEDIENLVKNYKARYKGKDNKIYLPDYFLKRVKNLEKFIPLLEKEKGGVFEFYDSEENATQKLFNSFKTVNILGSLGQSDESDKANETGEAENV
jgi:hypothetical protein